MRGSEHSYCAKITLASVCERAELARQLTKEALRKPVVERLAARREEEVERIADFLTKDSIQQALGRYLQSLRKPKL